MKKIILLMMVCLSVLLIGCGERAGEATRDFNCDAAWQSYENRCADKCDRAPDRRCQWNWDEIQAKCGDPECLDLHDPVHFYSRKLNDLDLAAYIVSLLIIPYYLAQSKWLFPVYLPVLFF